MHIKVVELINHSKWEALEQMGKMKLQQGDSASREGQGPDGECHPTLPSQSSQASGRCAMLLYHWPLGIKWS